MLVLTRREGERVLLHVPTTPATTITIAVTNLGHDCVGIDAPPEVNIVRAELASRPRNSERKATG